MDNLEILAEKIKNGGEKKDALYNALSDFIKGQKMRYLPFINGSTIEKDDLLSLIWLGIERAVETYTPEKDACFLTWATTCIRYCILEEIKKHKRRYFSLDVPMDEDGETFLIDTVSDPASLYAFSEAEDKTDGKRALLALKALPKEQQQIMTLCGIKNMPLSRAAKELNISVSRAKHLRFLALTKLKSMLT